MIKTDMIVKIGSLEETFGAGDGSAGNNNYRYLQTLNKTGKEAYLYKRIGALSCLLEIVSGVGRQVRSVFTKIFIFQHPC